MECYKKHKTILDVEQEEDVDEQLDTFFNSNGIPYTMYDVHKISITANQFARYCNAVTNKVTIVSCGNIKRLQDLVCDYIFVLFYYYSVRSKSLTIFGIIHVGQFDSLSELTYADLCVDPSEEYISSIYNLVETPNSRYIHCNVQPNTYKCCLYNNMDVFVDTNSSVALWRITLIHIITSCLRAHVEDRQKYVFAHIERYLSKHDMNDPLKLFNESNRALDNESYHLCKLIASYDYLFKRELIEAEQYFMDFKLQRYHKFERDFVVLVSNDHLLDFMLKEFLQSIKNGEEDEEQVLAKFKISTNEIMALDLTSFGNSEYIFCVPFHKFGFRESAAIQYVGGNVFFTYLDVDMYLKRRIYRDLHLTTHHMLAKKQHETFMDCVNDNLIYCKDQSGIIARIQKKYKESEPLYSRDVSILKRTIFTPCLSKISELRFMRQKTMNKCLDVTFNMEKSMDFTTKYVQYDSEEDEEEQDENNNENEVDDITLQLNIARIQKYKHTTLFELVAPPCVQKTIEMASKSHLKNSARIFLLSYLFSMEDRTKEEVYELWKDICDMPEEGSAGSREQTLQEFYEKNKFGTYAKSIYQLYMKSKQNGDANSICTSCESLAKQNFDDEEKTQICQFTTDIEDIGQNYRIRCKSMLKRKMHLYEGIGYDFFNPRRYHKEALRMLMNSN